MSKQFCVNCGYELSSYDKFCPVCGTQVLNAQTAGNIPPKAKAKSFGWCVWVIVGVVALLLLIGAFFLLRSVVRTSRAVVSSGKGSSSLSPKSESGFLHDLKEFHSAKKELERSWHEDVEVPYENLKKELQKNLKTGLTEELETGLKKELEKGLRKELEKGLKEYLENETDEE